jgi:hypothetical protein
MTGLIAEGKSTAAVQTPALLEYSKLNEKRMARLEKTFKLKDESASLLAQIDRPVLWLTLTEGWCGDAAQILPVLNGLSEANARLDLRLILRDAHPTIMDAFLTDGGRSIPKVIFIDPETRRVFGSWGPRPASAQAMMLATKTVMQDLQHDPLARKAYYQDAQTALHTWYARDRTESTQLEILTATLAALAESKQPALI